jgi:hypothetical protein
MASDTIDTETGQPYEEAAGQIILLQKGKDEL